MFHQHLRHQYFTLPNKFFYPHIYVKECEYEEKKAKKKKNRHIKNSC